VTTPSTTGSGPVGGDWWLDGHLDLAYLAEAGRDFTRPADPASGCVSYPDLREAPVRIAFGTIFTEAKAPGQPGGYGDSTDVEGAHTAGVRQLDWYLEQERLGAMRIIRTVRDLEAAAADGRPSAPLGIVLLMECADPIRTPSEAAWWFGRGVRVVGMSWGYGSRYSGGNSSGGGLTALGRELVAAFDGLGILHDVSHLSDASVDELLGVTTKRVVATHSNCRALLDAKERHLTDAQIRAIADRGGVIGLNLFGKFLAVGRSPTIDDAIAHVERVADLIGRMRTCLGSDLDGGFGPEMLPPGLKHPRDYRQLDAALARRGWSDAERLGFRHGHWMRVLRETLPR
jgi:membrane dipeptidase